MTQGMALHLVKGAHTAIWTFFVIAIVAICHRPSSISRHGSARTPATAFFRRMKVVRDPAARRI
ncbi:MAG: hypothetical protein OSB00_08585 [Sphingomonas bacterium]|nr:hypothetical protein [Sphingomonas bacterium]